MQLHSLKAKSFRMRARRVGRGGKRGKTSGHGGKGQTARAGHKIRPEMRDFLKKIPKRRGHGKNRARTVRVRARVEAVNLAALSAAFSAGDTVTARALLHKNLIRTQGPVKILGTGAMDKALKLSGLTVSTTARAAIEKAGGSIL